MQKELDRMMKTQNTTPDPEMDNLSPLDMYQLLYHTFDETSPIGIKRDQDSTLKVNPIFFEIFEIRKEKFKFRKARHSA